VKIAEGEAKPLFDDIDIVDGDTETIRLVKPKDEVTFNVSDLTKMTEGLLSDLSVRSLPFFRDVQRITALF
jgi:hypothetical protein